MLLVAVLRKVLIKSRLSVLCQHVGIFLTQCLQVWIFGKTLCHFDILLDECKSVTTSQALQGSNHFNPFYKTYYIFNLNILRRQR